MKPVHSAYFAAIPAGAPPLLIKDDEQARWFPPEEISF